VRSRRNLVFPVATADLRAAGYSVWLSSSGSILVNTQDGSRVDIPFHLLHEHELLPANHERRPAPGRRWANQAQRQNSTWTHSRQRSWSYDRATSSSGCPQWQRSNSQDQAWSAQWRTTHRSVSQLADCTTSALHRILNPSFLHLCAACAGGIAPEHPEAHRTPIAIWQAGPNFVRGHLVNLMHTSPIFRSLLAPPTSISMPSEHCSLLFPYAPDCPGLRRQFGEQSEPYSQSDPFYCLLFFCSFRLFLPFCSLWPSPLVPCHTLPAISMRRLRPSANQSKQYSPLACLAFFNVNFRLNFSTHGVLCALTCGKLYGLPGCSVSSLSLVLLLAVANWPLADHLAYSSTLCNGRVNARTVIVIHYLRTRFTLGKQNKGLQVRSHLLHYWVLGWQAQIMACLLPSSYSPSLFAHRLSFLLFNPRSHQNSSWVISTLSLCLSRNHSGAIMAHGCNRSTAQVTCLDRYGPVAIQAIVHAREGSHPIRDHEPPRFNATVGSWMRLSSSEGALLTCQCSLDSTFAYIYLASNCLVDRFLALRTNAEGCVFAFS
jgi:hypothetical protein